MTTWSLFSPKMFSAKYVSFAVINHCSNTCSLFKYIISFTKHQLFLKTLTHIHNKRTAGHQFYVVLSNVTFVRMVSPFLHMWPALHNAGSSLKSCCRSHARHVIQALCFNYEFCLHMEIFLKRSTCTIHVSV
jgi:hypothetical protein